MSLVIESGVRDGNRLAVFDDRMKEFEVQQSATNYVSTSQLNGRTGVFTVRNSGSTTIGNANRNRVLSITNNDQINLMIIDSAYIQIFSSSITLPDPNLNVLIEFKSGASTVSIINEDRFSTITPIITARGIGTAGSTTDPKISQMTATLGDVNDFISSGTDSIIIQGLPTSAANTISTNTIGLSIQNITGGSVTIGLNVFIRFMMVPPDSLG